MVSSMEKKWYVIMESESYSDSTPTPTSKDHPRKGNMLAQPRYSDQLRMLFA